MDNYPPKTHYDNRGGGGGGGPLTLTSIAKCDCHVLVISLPESGESPKEGARGHAHTETDGEAHLHPTEAAGALLAVRAGGRSRHGHTWKYNERSEARDTGLQVKVAPCTRHAKLRGHPAPDMPS